MLNVGCPNTEKIGADSQRSVHYVAWIPRSVKKGDIPLCTFDVHALLSLFGISKQEYPLLDVELNLFFE